ncbi:peptidyl-prolyl cis-trans isomerase [Caulobacter sp. SLTY]|uniref:peptidylprolyl isomerase n=1 Tax=Caulobacter sp. SLTY TaxID=2683262 RepID=UPI0014134628|nr:peptidyl-prolyl cis-trans isomerase [Caulobacter sp. SLTY]
MIRRSGLMFALTAVVMALSLAACGDKPINEKPPETGDVVVARVDGEPIWASDVKREAVAQGQIGEGEPLDIQSDLFRQVLDQVVDQELLAAEAVRLGLDKGPLAQRRLASARKRILGAMLVESVVEKAVTEENIQTLYREQQKLSAQSEEYKARQIVVATPAAAEDIKKLLAAGASFDAMAMERSTDSATRFSGGDMGGYFTLDMMSPPYQAALKTAQPGQLVGPFAVEGGWAIVRVDEKRPEEPITLEAARPQIVRFLTYGQVRDLLEKLRGGAKVETLLPKGQKLPGAPSEPANAPPPKAAPPPAPGSAPLPTAPVAQPPAKSETPQQK